MVVVRPNRRDKKTKGKENGVGSKKELRGAELVESERQ